MLRATDRYVGSGEPYRRETPNIPSVENPILSAEPLRPVRGDIPREGTKAERIVGALRVYGPLPSSRIVAVTGVEATSLSNALRNCREVLVEHYHDAAGNKRRMFYLEGQDPAAAIASILADAQPAAAPAAEPAPAPEPAPEPTPAPAPAQAPRSSTLRARFAVWSDGSVTIKDRMFGTAELSPEEADELLRFLTTARRTA